MMEILIASNNPDKVGEIQAIFRETEFCFRYPHEFAGLPEVVEDGNTLPENALKKAKVLSEFCQLPAISDDTGLEVDALHGGPGIYSARFAGLEASYQDNLKKLLDVMQDIPFEKRQARFRTVAVFYHPELLLQAEGVIEGTILTAPRGRKGFGYDPVFYIPEMDQTFAEMDPADKNRISHRSRAFRQLHTLLLAQLPKLTPKSRGVTH